METALLSLSDFLLARIAEEEVALVDDSHLATMHRRAELDAMRRIVREDNGFERVVRLLALPYSDHPDYQPEWRP